MFVAGVLTSRRIDGPGTINALFAAWELFGVAMVSLGHARVRSTNRYRHGIQRLNTLFPGRWGLICTMDAIVRTERWTALREEVEEDRPTIYDPIYAVGLRDLPFCVRSPGPNAEWWKQHFEVPMSVDRDGRRC